MPFLLGLPLKTPTRVQPPPGRLFLRWPPEVPLPLSGSLNNLKLRYSPLLKMGVEDNLQTDCRFQLATISPYFSSLIASRAQRKSTWVLLEEISAMLNKNAIKIVLHEQRVEGFYLRYFLVPKKWVNGIHAHTHSPDTHDVPR